LIISGITTDGGYAEVVIAESRALASIPDVVASADAAPLLCAGVTTYNALRNANLRGRSGRHTRHRRFRASRCPVRQAHGISNCRHRSWEREGETRP
jgi:hypothetical protein